MSRHQCLIYEGSPSRILRSVAEAAHQKLNERYRCLYLNSAPMVAGMKSCLASVGVDVAREISDGSLMLSCEQNHLVAGAFDVERMIQTIETAVEQALRDGYRGLWASGDMTWEFGPRQDFGKLLEYEWRLEELFRKVPFLGGVCQYHKDTLPLEALHLGLRSHASIFVNETLSWINPHFVVARSSAEIAAIPASDLNSIIARLAHLQGN